MIARDIREKFDKLDLTNFTAKLTAIELITEARKYEFHLLADEMEDDLEFETIAQC